MSNIEQGTPNGSTLSTWFDLAHHRPLKTGLLTIRFDTLTASLSEVEGLVNW
jgi:hypothetical protein